MRKFRSPNAGRTSLSLQHDTSPRSSYRPALGANRDGYPMGGIPIRTGFKVGGRVGLKKGKSADKNWMQDVSNQLKNVELKASVHLLQKKVALDEQKR